jgi:glycosyltransferase involved in cell wall biosynthesis
MDLFVLPSIWEGLPTVVMESMACGVPVVATDIPGTRELIRNGVTGWLVPSRDSGALASAILHALGDYEVCKETAARGREAMKGFSIGVVAQNYALLYKRLVS